MRSIEIVPDLLTTCQTEFARLLDAFESAPTRSGLFDIGAVAEVAVLGDGIPETHELQSMIADAAARCLRSGLLEELCFARVELTYHAALLAYLARTSAAFTPTDMATMKRLCEGRLIGRSEMPVLSQQLVAAYLTRCGVEADFGDLGDRDLVTMIDKRVLRGRSDEYDLMVVLMCAQLLHLSGESVRSTPVLFPEVLLVQAIRSENANWLPVLAWVCAHSFSLGNRLREAALKCMLQLLPGPGNLLPAPEGAGIDSEYIGHAGRGLRIRSTLALAFSLLKLGDSHGEITASLAIA